MSFLFVVACAGTNFKWEDTEKIKPGMSESEVVAILGKPYMRKADGTKTKLIWSYAGMGGTRAVAYVFEDGVMLEQTATVGK